MLLGQSLAIVTGTDCPIGAEVARLLAEAGADVVSVAATGAGSPAGDGNGRHVTVAYDPADAAASARANGEIAATMGREPDILVNLTGFRRAPYRPIWEMPVEAYDVEFDGGLRSAFLFMKQFMPGMVARARGRIVNVGRIDGHRGAEGQSVAGGLGWALRGLTRSAALEAGEFGVTVNLVACGALEGEAVLPRTRDALSVEPALRRRTTARDIASAVTFLASDMGRSITGQELVVDGGTIV